jgi:hypothetical protein
MSALKFIELPRAKLPVYSPSGAHGKRAGQPQFEPVSTGLDGIDQLIPARRYAAEGRKQGRQATREVAAQGFQRHLSTSPEIGENRRFEPRAPRPMDTLLPAMLTAKVRQLDGPLTVGRTADGRFLARTSPSLFQPVRLCGTK